jgi:hypothetical protein
MVDKKKTKSNQNVSDMRPPQVDTDRLIWLAIMDVLCRKCACTN